MLDLDNLLSFLFLVSAVAIGVWSERKGGSFVAGFFAAILLTPFFAALILALRNPARA